MTAEELLALKAKAEADDALIEMNELPIISDDSVERAISNTVLFQSAVRDAVSSELTALKEKYEKLYDPRQLAETINQLDDRVEESFSKWKDDLLTEMSNILEEHKEEVMRAVDKRLESQLPM
jgi:gas vesicle protein